MTHSQRLATCACGQLTFTLDGAPAMVVMCHCEDCQKRTGSTHQVAAWFHGEQLESRSGKCKIFERVGALGTVRFEFCGECGSTVSWTHSSTPQARAIALGCLADPLLPRPQVEYFTSRRHPWMAPLDGAAQFESQPGSSDIA